MFEVGDIVQLKTGGPRTSAFGIRAECRPSSALGSRGANKRRDRFPPQAF
jgi:uncharacterized protein YodC (DUF2158 family)